LQKEKRKKEKKNQLKFKISIKFRNQIKNHVIDYNRINQMLIFDILSTIEKLKKYTLKLLMIIEVRRSL
jgi:hypothetical protein